MKRVIILALSLTVIVHLSCRSDHRNVIVFHAGSLSVPMKELKKEFEAENPGITVLLESSGSIEAARKISDLGKPCDIMASADYMVIGNILMPDFAEFNVRFASNEMALVHSEKSRFAGEINAENWPDILLRNGVKYGHSDPEKDHCGYRSQLVWQLAEIHYRKPGLYGRLKKSCPPKNIRPKEVALIALVETGALDYIFLYRSVAVQHGLPFVELPREINLGDPAMAAGYGRASLEITGKKPGEKIVVRGEPMIYGVTMVRNPQNKEDAPRFLSLMLGGRGLEIFKRLGQAPLDPPLCAEPDRLPGELRGLVGALKQ